MLNSYQIDVSKIVRQNRFFFNELLKIKIWEVDNIRRAPGSKVPNSTKQNFVFFCFLQPGSPCSFKGGGLLDKVNARRCHVCFKLRVFWTGAVICPEFQIVSLDSSRKLRLEGLRQWKLVIVQLGPSLKQSLSLKVWFKDDH